MKPYGTNNANLSELRPADNVRPLMPVRTMLRRSETTLGRRLEVLAVLQTSAAKDAVIDAINGNPGIGARVDTGDIKKLSVQALTDAEAEVLLLDIDLGNAAELNLLDEIKRLLPSSRSIVVTSNNPTLEGMRHLMRLNIPDFVPQPVQRSDLLRALAAAIEQKPATSSVDPEPQGCLICFRSVCGGMGATTLAVQSACALGGGGKVRNESNDKSDKAAICVLDLDVQLGNAALYLDQSGKNSVVDLLGAIDRLDGAMLRNAMVHHRCHVDILAAPFYIEPLDELTPEGISRLLQIARREYRNILVDLPTAWTSWTRAAIHGADVLALVLQPSVPAVRQAKRQLDALAEEGLEEAAVALVMNRLPQHGLFRRSPSTVTLKDAVAALGREITYTVPDEYKSALEAVNHGLPLFEVKGAHVLAKRIADNMKSILAEIDKRRTSQVAARR